MSVWKEAGGKTEAEIVITECNNKAREYYDYRPGKPGCPTAPMRKADWWGFAILFIVAIIFVVLSGTVVIW